MIILTGGAGFIGSALLFELNQRGQTDILVVDAVDHPRKVRNLAALKYRELLGIGDFRRHLAAGDYDSAGVSGVLHIGACSATTETNWEYLQDNNIACTQEIIQWCVNRGVSCVYASSAATYGDGEHGFTDEHSMFDRLMPLNLYGKSKLDVDVWARDRGYLDHVAGLRYFNVFGPNEWHKEGMRSVVNKKFPEIRDTGKITLFKSYRPNYADGAQERDFVYVRDVVDITLWFLEQKDVSGVFNVGTGLARTWNDMARAMCGALYRPTAIRYVEMPENLRNQYQYHTKADVTKLRRAGYDRPFTSLEDSINDYIRGFLAPDRHLGEAPLGR